MPAYYPAYLNLEGRRCVVIGGGAVAERKVAALLKAGAQVTLVSPAITRELKEKARAGTMAWVRRRYRPGDLRDAYLAIAATDNEAVNDAIAQEAEAGKVLLNVVDNLRYCTFIAPSVIERDGLIVAISTGGKSPAMARKVREELEGLLPPEYGTVLGLVANVRGRLLREGKRAPGDLWQRALSPEVMELARKGKLEEAQSTLMEALREGPSAAS